MLITQAIKSNFFFKFRFIFLVGIVFCNPFVALSSSAVFDDLSRLVSYPGKQEVACPSQDKNTAVLLAIGQSNIANHGQVKFSTLYPNKVFNYFNGKCYIASSPLLGASGEGGEFLTSLGDNLVDFSIYDKVIIISSGINNSMLYRWSQGGDLNTLLKSILAEVQTRYKITEVIFHQGETDFLINTTKEKYIESFHSLLRTLRPVNKSLPPVYFAIATLCGNNWFPFNSIAQAQYTFADEINNIYLGANTDALIPISERFDVCHFNMIGQLKAAYTYANAIQQNKVFY
ncbi:MAG: hypothetical protein H0U70_04575 [Tatlockia sp.]|nr:hypothetical protein [Tatlockia sp.]